MVENNSLFEPEDLIDVYTSEQAEEDGVLVDITRTNPSWKMGLFNYVTSNLLCKGYIKEDKIYPVCVCDLLNQALEIVRIETKDFTVPDTFFSGKVEFPDGVKRIVFIERNEHDKLTIMLPEDR